MHNCGVFSLRCGLPTLHSGWHHSFSDGLDCRGWCLHRTVHQLLQLRSEPLHPTRIWALRTSSSSRCDRLACCGHVRRNFRRDLGLVQLDSLTVRCASAIGVKADGASATGASATGHRRLGHLSSQRSDCRSNCRGRSRAVHQFLKLLGQGLDAVGGRRLGQFGDLIVRVE